MRIWNSTDTHEYREIWDKDGKFIGTEMEYVLRIGLPQGIPCLPKVEAFVIS